MKLVIREYLASLKERDELDAILPDLLSELGYTVYSRPSRGTRQHGVDVAALGPGTGNDRRVYLFSIKQGDLTRADWNGALQSLRPSLDEIVDVYIPTRIPQQHRSLKIVICLCFGGDIHEGIRTDVKGYIDKHTTADLSFEDWNGDRIAAYIEDGLLREDILPKGIRPSFQKAVAMVDLMPSCHEPPLSGPILKHYG